MRMALVVMVVMLAALGCSKRYVVIPDNPDAKKCQRECMTIRGTCRGKVKACDAREQDCYATCPGAKWSDEVDAQTSSSRPAEESRPYVEAPEEKRVDGPTMKRSPVCLASALPEWEGATAEEKKALLAKCRGE